MLRQVNYSIPISKTARPSFKGQDICAVDDKSEYEKSPEIQKLITFLKSNSIIPIEHSINEHIVPERLGATALDVLIPIVEKKQIVKQLMEMNNYQETEFNNLSDNYKYTASLSRENKLLIKASDKTAENSYRIAVTPSWSHLISFYNLNTKVNMPEQKRTNYILESIANWEKENTRQLREKEKNEIVQKTLKLQDYLDKKSIDITWWALVNAVMLNITGDELISTLNKPLIKAEKLFKDGDKENKVVYLYKPEGNYKLWVKDSGILEKRQIVSITNTEKKRTCDETSTYYKKQSKKFIKRGN